MKAAGPKSRDSTRDRDAHKSGSEGGPEYSPDSAGWQGPRDRSSMERRRSEDAEGDTSPRKDKEGNDKE